ncbi:MAG: alanine--tRNA ligase [Candidatus Levybacteria bacterium]|nr:alanine--tRNA ligase [Candidatus Levybacteria bacterium]
MTASEILNRYIQFFEKRGHVRIENSSLVPLNDPTTLFTSSGMQPLVPFLLGEQHPQGLRLVNAQNCFRAQDIDEIGDNRHTTFFRMLGNWSLGDPASPGDTASLGGYFKKEQISWFFEFLTSKTEGLGLDPSKLYVTVFSGFDGIEEDKESLEIWKNLFEEKGINSENRIFKYGVEKNWWSRSGTPDKMPIGEPGGPDSEVFYDFGEDLGSHEIYEKTVERVEPCHVNCDCGRYMEIGNSVFMQYIKRDSGFEKLPKQNVDFGGGLERLVAATENKQDVFETSLFYPIIESIVSNTKKEYKNNAREMRIVLDHFLGSIFISSNNVKPSNKEQGYLLRRLIRRGLDNFYLLSGSDISPILETIVNQYKETDPILVEKFEEIKNTILEEESTYQKALSGGKKMIEREIAKISDEVTVGDELMGVTQISADVAFKAITSFGLGPTQLKSLGYIFDDQELAQKIKEHQELSRKGAAQKFAGGLADHSELTVKGHTATHLMHQALRDVLGNSVHQTGSNITEERVRFDFAFDRKVTDEEIQKVTDIVNSKIKNDLPVHFEIMPLQKARDLGAIGLFNDKYAEEVKIYFVGDYSVEFCGGPHVEKTSHIKSFAILKEEGVARGVRRIYVKVT